MSFLDVLSKMAKDYSGGIDNKTTLSVHFEYGYMGVDELTKLDNSTNKVYYYKLPYDNSGKGIVFTGYGLFTSAVFAYIIYGNVERSYTYIAPGIPEYVIPLIPLIFVIGGLVTILQAKIGVQPEYEIALVISDDILYLVDKDGLVTKIDRGSIKKAELTESKSSKKVYYHLQLYYTHPNYEDEVKSTYLLNYVKGEPRMVVDDIIQTYGLPTETHTNKIPSITNTK